ncbi:DUF559 domain-containing protein [Leucobacter sp. GX24907]
MIQAASLLNIRELVVAIDHLICPRGSTLQALVGREELERALLNSRARGARLLRAAMRIARPGAESRMESLVHFELARLGLDDLEMQANLHDQAGRWIGRFDLVCRRRKLIIEYDGEQHRTDRAQYLKDVKRIERAQAAGYRILRLHKEDFVLARLSATRRLLCDFLGAAQRPVPVELDRYFAAV